MAAMKPGDLVTPIIDAIRLDGPVDRRLVAKAGKPYAVIAVHPNGAVDVKAEGDRVVTFGPGAVVAHG